MPARADHEHEHGDEHGGAGSAIAHRVDALVARLAARGVADETAVDAALVRFFATAGPRNGARIVARAWRDAAFTARLLDDANAAIGELGLDLSAWAPVRLRAVANGPRRHNVIVCTLCSCYPIALLGPSPAWYKSEAYRSRVVREPRAVLRELGLDLGDDVRITVWDSTAELRYVVIPNAPPDAASASEEELAARVTRDALIGVAAI